ncbi:MAG TPA: efflux RND transporter permease subunit, partial [Gemmatimonadales bacterium]|nr:efflux RND transporter permease subunit [Gemmatimonadales bacterium]
MFLSDLSIKRPVFASMMMLALVVLGLFSYRRLNIDQFPDVEFPFLVIQTRYAGASPESVEREVTKKIEESVNTVEGVKRIQSTSTEGFSTIYVLFNLGTKLMDAQADVRAKIDAIRQNLPADIDPPVISRANPSDQPIFVLAVQGENWALRDLTRLADEVVSRRIENVSGVGSVTLVGGLKREIHVLLEPDRLQALGISPDMVTAALRRENGDVPAGRVEQGNAEQLVRVAGKVRDPRDFAALIVTTRNGIAVRLGQIARIEDAQEEARDIAYVNGNRAVALEVRKTSGANTVEATDHIKAVMAELEPTLPHGVRLAVVQDNSTWIRNSVDDVQKTLLEGAFLTVLIVFLFLNSWRSTVITGLTLPVSVIASFLAIYAFGFTINIMTLMALSLAIGILIDDAIVVRENIVRHVERGEDHYTAARKGTAEIGFAVLATTMSVIAVFVPVAFMKGIVGRFFFPFGITVAFAVLVSLFVSFTLDPMLSSLWYDPQAEGGARRGPIGRALERFNNSFQGLGQRYRRIIAWALDHRLATMGIAAAAFIAAMSLFGLGLVGGQFMPNSDNEQTLLTIETPVGSSVDYTAGKALELSSYLKRLPEVALTYATVGGAQQNEAVNKGQIYVKLTAAHSRERTQQQLEADLRKVLPQFQGVAARVEQIGAAGGNQAPIQLNLQGPALARLQVLSDTSLAAIRNVPGLVDLRSSLEGRKPEFSVEVNRDLAADVGLSVGGIGAALRPVLTGEQAGTWEDETGLAHDVVVRLVPESRQTETDLARIPLPSSRLDTRTGAPVMIPLRQVAAIRSSAAPNEIKRLDLERVATIEGNYQGRPLTDVVKDVRTRLATLDLPPGYRFDFGGEQKDFAETVGYMLESLTLAIVFIYLILASQFGSFLQPLAIMLSLPLSLVGVMLALMLTRGTFNIMSMIGVIMLMGLVTKNASLLIDFANKARESGSDRRKALIDAGELRLRPIVMTTLAMIFGMLPTALALGAGAEFRAPMAHAVIGGLITSTLLTLVVVPVVYTYLDDFGAWVGAGVKQFTSAPESAHEPKAAAAP